MYMLSVNNITNGCIATQVVEVLLDTLGPLAQIEPPLDIDCNDPSVDLNAGNSAQGEDILYQWTAPDGSLLGTDIIQTAEVDGTYTLMVSDTSNGCSSLALTEVGIDTLRPPISLGDGYSLTCTAPLLSLSAGLASIDSLIFEWQLEGATISTDSVIEVSLPGLYSLLVTNAENGCSNFAEATVIENTMAPVADAGSGGILTCTSGCLPLGGANTSLGPDYTYQWTGNTAAVSDPVSPNPEACAPDTYVLSVVNTTNGCIASDTVLVTEDAGFPTVVAQTEDTLSCGQGQALLSGQGSSAGLDFSYEWRDQDGQLLSTNLETMVFFAGYLQFCSS